MTSRQAAVWIVLALGLGVEALCCLGVLAMRDAFSRIHYLGPATSLGAVLIAAAVVVAEGLTASGVKAILLALTLLVTGPVVSHALGRAARLREFGDLDVRPGEDIADRGVPR